MYAGCHTTNYVSVLLGVKAKKYSRRENPICTNKGTKKKNASPLLLH